MTHAYRIVRDPEPSRGPFRVSTATYLYSLEDEDGREVVAYHWQPDGRSPITWPHLHLGAACEIGNRWVADAHLPTGRVAIEQVLRLAIEDLGAEPLRDDWRDVLEETLDAHRQWRSWG